MSTMSPVFASRRRAEEFASLVEGSPAGTPRDARYAEFLSIIEGLRDVPDPEPRPEFVATLREQLMASADTLLVPAQPERLRLPARSPSRDRKLAAAIGGFAVVGASTSMALAAQSALPGEMLYPLKRVIENAEIGMPSEADAKAMTLLESATTRLAEMAALNREGELAANTTAAESTLVDFREQATEGSELVFEEYDRTGDERLIRRLHRFTAGSMESLALLEPLVPEAAHDELMEAARTLSEIDARAEKACPSCGGGITQIPTVLLAADDTAAPRTVVVPGTTVASPRDGRRSGDRDHDRDRPAGDGDGTSDADPADQPIDTSGVVTAPGDGPAGAGAGSGGGDDPLGGIDDLIGGTDTSTSDPGGSGGLGDLGVLGDLGDIGDQVEDGAEEAGTTIDDTVDDLTDLLTD
jgi:hypothetical protein